ncbi:ornithine carbamoyltransferase [Xylariales sp. PMI_506]|nr:ornithine carbamoyltransferase [Xylariales sp. PMI_506]
MRTAAFRLSRAAYGTLQTRSYSSLPPVKTVRGLMSIADLTRDEFSQLVRNAAAHKTAIKSGKISKEFSTSLAGKTIAMMFSKRSTRTRVSTEAAVALMGGHPMFLGKDDIQLGVNESLYDTSKVISSMTSCMVARVGPHSDVTGLAGASTVPVINALSDDFHPLQAIADFLTIYESTASNNNSSADLLPKGLKVAWVGDSNNVLYDLATACVKLGVDISVASPPDYSMSAQMEDFIRSQGDGISHPGKLQLTNSPKEAIDGSNYVVTDTWVSMGQEAETQKRLREFAGYQINDKLMGASQPHPDWKFLHCLPRHQEEVADDVFYSDRSLVFQEAENRLYAAIAALEAFVVNKGKIVKE